MEKEDECVSVNERGKKRKKKTYWGCEFRINELAKFSGHNNADIQANFHLHTDLSLNTLFKKKKTSKLINNAQTSKKNQGAILSQLCT